jgi:TolA-binding protein
MAESLWEPEAVGVERPQWPVASPEPESGAELIPDSGATAISVDEFAALEERILRAVKLVRHERTARAAAEARVQALDTQLRDAAPRIERLEDEVRALRGERDQVRQRVERLLAQLDALEL